jgi:dipeptidyl aminopeptidase/acylaminoacyl peptidase
MAFLANGRDRQAAVDRLLVCVLAAAGCLCSSHLPSAEAGLRPVPVREALAAASFRRLGSLAAISPDGQFVAYTVCDPKRHLVSDHDVDTAFTSTGTPVLSVGCDVFVQSTKATVARNVSEGKGSNWLPVWSPNGRHLAFYSDRDGASRVWLWNRDDGRLTRASEVITRVLFGFDAAAWTPDGTRLIVKVLPEGKTPQEMVHGQLEHAVAGDEKEPGSTVAIHRSVPPDNDQPQRIAPPDELLADLAVVDLSTGDCHRIRRNVRANGFSLSPDGMLVAIATHTGRTSQDSQTNEYDFLILRLDGTERAVVHHVRQDLGLSFNWSPDGRQLAYLSTDRSAGAETWGPTDAKDVNDSSGLFLISMADGTIKRFHSPAGITFTAGYRQPRWSPTGKALYFVSGGRLWRGVVDTNQIAAVTGEASRDVLDIVSAQDQAGVWSRDGGRSICVVTQDHQTKQNGFYKVDTTTEAWTKLLEEPATYGRRFEAPIASTDGQYILYRSERADRAPEIWIAAADFGATRPFSDLNPTLRKYAYGGSRVIDYLSLDGQPLHAALLLPPDYRDGHRCPLVIWLYASALGSQNVNRFGLMDVPFNLQMLATRGYAVLWPDIPVHKGSPLQDILKGVMPALDKAIELGIGDPDRLAVMGQSNGGYSVLSLLVQTRRFHAAIMNAGFGDLVGLYGVMGPNGAAVWSPWLEQFGGGMTGPPWEVPQMYVQNSPVFFLDRLTTPLLIQAGAADEGIVHLSDEVFVGLQRLQKDVTYLRYNGEGHVLASYPNLVDYWNRVLAFLAQKLGPSAHDTSTR